MNGIDPQAPFIAQDGLEYEDLAAKILDQPLDSWRNVEILTRRARGDSESSIRRWIKAYDGDDYTPGNSATHDRVTRAGLAWLDGEGPKGRAAAGAGRTDLRQAPVDSVHAAPQPSVPRRLGPPGYRSPP